MSGTWQQANPERRREIERRYRERNREALRVRGREFYRANRDRLNAQAQQRYRDGPGRETKRRYYLANHERINAQNRAYQAARRQELRAAQQYRAHGWQPQDWAAQWAAQDGRCYLCGEPLDLAKTVVEHDHRCCGPDRSCRWCRRGLACHPCNLLIGLAGDDPARLRRIAANLAKAQKRLGRLPKPLTLFDLEDT